MFTVVQRWESYMYRIPTQGSPRRVWLNLHDSACRTATCRETEQSFVRPFVDSQKAVGSLAPIVPYEPRFHSGIRA